MRWLTLVSLGLMVAARPGGATRPASPLCDGGRFLVDGGDLLPGGPTLLRDAVVIDPTGPVLVGIDSGCAPRPGRETASVRGTHVQVRWPHCGSLAGAVRLRAKLDPTCSVLSGVLSRRRGALRRAFTASRSSCGDGFVDVAAGEACDGAAACDDGSACRDCECVVATTTSTTQIDATSTSVESTTTTASPTSSTTSTTALTTTTTASTTTTADSSTSTTDTTTTDTSSTTTTIPVVILTPGGTVAAADAVFGAQSFDLTALVVRVDDGSSSTACTAVTTDVSGKIALVDRGTCTFVAKALNVQAAGAVGMILVNDAATTVRMGGTDPTVTVGILSISQPDGAALVAALLSGPVTAEMYRP